MFCNTNPNANINAHANPLTVTLMQNVTENEYDIHNT